MKQPAFTKSGRALSAGFGAMLVLIAVVTLLGMVAAGRAIRVARPFAYIFACRHRADIASGRRWRRRGRCNQRDRAKEHREPVRLPRRPARAKGAAPWPSAGIPISIH